MKLEKGKYKRVLLIQPSGTKSVYNKSKVKGQVHPPLTLATLAGALIEARHLVDICDLSVEPYDKLSRLLHSVKYDIIGITFATNGFSEFHNIAMHAWQKQPNTVIVCGGPHATALPDRTLKSQANIVVLGEGEETIVEIANGEPWEEIKGIVYKDTEGKIRHTSERDYIKDLDKLPALPWYKFDLSLYKNPRSFGLSPLGIIETSRGCPHQCIYCNKNVFGYLFRKKSPDRVVQEFKDMEEQGFKELYIADDGFTTDLSRAKQICRLLIEKEVNIRWNLGNGVRVDSIDEEFLKLAKKAGCYRIHFGIETANESVMKRIKKGITMEEARTAFSMAKGVGLDTCAYFMIGFPGETEESMQQAIDFALELDPDYARVAVVVPYPGTELYNDWFKKGLLIPWLSGSSWDYQWEKFAFHNAKDAVYKHPTLDNKTIFKYYAKFYRKFYWRPSYMLKRVWKGMLRGTLFADAGYFIKNFVGSK